MTGNALLHALNVADRRRKERVANFARINRVRRFTQELEKQQKEAHVVDYIEYTAPGTLIRPPITYRIPRRKKRPQNPVKGEMYVTPQGELFIYSGVNWTSMGTFDGLAT